MTYEEKKRWVESLKPYTYTHELGIFAYTLELLIEELEKAWSALSFYAEEAQWLDSAGYPLHAELPIDKDAGKRAWEALNDS